jgi:histidyl-tRNA synthetase
MYFTADAAAFFDEVERGLRAAGVEFRRNPRLVRGLDYYRHTAFEFVTDRLGAQGAVIAGGRYDGLIESLGGPHTPAVGWAAGIERLAMLIEVPERERIAVSVVVEDDRAQSAGIVAVAALRRAGIVAELVASGSPRKRFDKAIKASPLEIISIGYSDGEPLVILKAEAGKISPASEILAKIDWSGTAVK